MIVGTIDAAAEAISVGVLDRGRDDADVRLDHLHDPGRVRAHPGSAALACAVALRRPICLHGRLATSGTLTHWFADQLARDLSPEAAMAALAAEARASPPGANGLVFLPYFSGERTPIHDPNAKGAIVGLTLAHTRADIYRASLEGIAFATKHIFDTYAEAGAPPTTIVAVGGGLRNRTWTQATSDVSGLAQEARRSASALPMATPFSRDLRSAMSPDQRSSSGTPPLSQLSLIRAMHAFTRSAMQPSASFIRAPATSWRSSARATKTPARSDWGSGKTPA